MERGFIFRMYVSRFTPPSCVPCDRRRSNKNSWPSSARRTTTAAGSRSARYACVRVCVRACKQGDDARLFVCRHRLSPFRAAFSHLALAPITNAFPPHENPSTLPSTTTPHIQASRLLHREGGSDQLVWFQMPLIDVLLEAYGADCMVEGEGVALGVCMCECMWM